MFKKYFKNKRQQRFANMERKVPNLPDWELKEWYSCADTQRLMGDFCEYEAQLLQVIEEELVKRGFEHQADF